MQTKTGKLSVSQSWHAVAVDNPKTYNCGLWQRTTRPELEI